MLLATGMISGMISRTITHPLERLRILQQTNQSSKYNNRNVSESIKFMYKNEGIKGLFRGNGVSIMLQSPFTAFEFFFYDVFKTSLYTDSKNLSYGQKLVCGGLSGIIATFLTHPLDVIKTYTVTRNISCKKTFINISKQMVKEQGTSKLYSGIGVSLIGVPIFIGLRMSTYDSLSQVLQQHIPNELLAHGVSGSAAGILAVSICYPLDVLRRIMHMNGTSRHHNYTGVFDAMSQRYNKQGVSGFYRGFYATLAKQTPMTMIMFACNHKLRKIFSEC